MNIIKDYKTFLIILCLLASSISFFYELDGSFLKGTDAYYYALQADHWARTGDVKIPDSSLVHRQTGLLQRTGLITENSLKLFQSISILLLGLSIFFTIGKKRNILTFSALLLFVSSPSVFFVIIEFPKMFCFLFLVPLWLYYSTFSGFKSFYALVPVLLSIFFHKASIPIAGLFSCSLFLRNFLSHIIKLKLFILILSLITSVIFFYLFFVSDSLHLPDLTRFSFENMSPGFLVLLQRESLPVAIKFEMLLMLALYLGSVIVYIRSKGSVFKILFTFPLLLPGFFPFGVNEVFSIGERFAILLPVFFLISSLFLLSQIGDYKNDNDNADSGIGKVLIFLIPLPLIFIFRLEIAHPDYLDPNIKDYDTVTENIKNYDIPMLIAHRGLNFYYKYKLRKEAFLYEPEDHWNKKRIWRAIYKISNDELTYYLDEKAFSGGFIRGTGVADYFLIREDYWVKMRSKVTIDDDIDLYNRIWKTWLNPSKKRPSFLYRKHRKAGLYSDDEGEFPALPPSK
ncbi:MAG: hypothetical protein GY760_27905 [Deltaproteobacteria bacterium]|nr:hypothetical protein [Deltaproteobacteria bacterium]